MADNCYCSLEYVLVSTREPPQVGCVCVCVCVCVKNSVFQKLLLNNKGILALEVKPKPY